jgi:hypothetical protein
MQLMFLGSVEQTRNVADGVYLARISSAASGTTDIWADWEGKPGGAGTSVTNASRFRQRLSVVPPAVVFTLSGGGGPERTWPPRAHPEIASTPAFFASMSSADASGTAYRDDDWWVTVSSGQCVQIVQAIR